MTHTNTEKQKRSRVRLSFLQHAQAYDDDKPKHDRKRMKIKIGGFCSLLFFILDITRFFLNLKPRQSALAALAACGEGGSASSSLCERLWSASLPTASRIIQLLLLSALGRGCSRLVVLSLAPCAVPLLCEAVSKPSRLRLLQNHHLHPSFAGDCSRVESRMWPRGDGAERALLAGRERQTACSRTPVFCI
jgi:hypothetical protein